MKRSDSILQNYYMSKLPKYQQRPGTVDQNAIKAYMMGLPGRAPKQLPKGLTQMSARDIQKQQYDLKYRQQDEAEQARLRRLQEEEKRRIAEGKAAERTRESVIRGNADVPFTFPTGETKLWKDMDWREQQYVSGKNLGSTLRYNNWTDYINPLAMIGDLGEGLATAPYTARQTNSILPYVSGIGAPLLVGSLANIGAPTTSRFVENLVSPVSGVGKYLTTQTPLRNAYKLNPRAFNLERKIAKENIPVRQIFGDEAYENFLKYGPSTRPGVSEIDQMMDFIKLPETEVIIGRTGERMKMTGLSNQYEVPYFSQGRLWYQGPSRKYMLEQGPERIIIPKNASNLEFYPAGERDVILEPEKYLPESVDIFAGPRRVLLPSPAKKAYDPANFEVYEGVPHWWRGYQPAKTTGGTSIIPEASVKSTSLLPEEITAENLPNFVNIEKNIAGNQGAFNFGIYPIKQNENILLKLDDYTGAGFGGGFSKTAEELQNVPDFRTGLVEAMADINDPMISKVLQEMSLTGKVGNIPNAKLQRILSNNPNVPVAGRLITRVDAKPISTYSPEELGSIPIEYYQQLLDRLRYLREKNLGVDQIGDNFLLNIANNNAGFGVVDIGKLKQPTTSTMDPSFFFGLEKGMGPVDVTGFKNRMFRRMSSNVNEASALAGEGSYGSEQLSNIIDAIRNNIYKVKKQGGPIVNQRGFMDGEPPIGSNWRIPGNTLYNPTPYKIRAVGSNGIEKTLKPFDTKRVSFGNAQYVDEYKMKAGGLLPKAQIGRYITGFHSNLVMPAVNSILGYFQQQPNPVQQPVAPTNQQKPVNYGMGDYYSLYSKYADKVSTGRRENDRIIGDAKSDVRIPLSSGRFRGANVSQNLIKNAVNAAKQYNVDPWLLVSVIGRESAFGEGDQANKVRAGNYRDLLSGWNLAEDFQPYDPLRYLADRRAPGIIVKKTPHGWNYDVTDQKALNEYLKQNVGIYEKYADKLEKTPKLGNLNSLQLAARFLKSHKVGDYNPGDPNYTRMVYEDMKLLKSDPKMKEYMKTLGYKMGGLTPNKAREILHHGEVGGRKLTDKQRRFFGAMSKGHTKKYQLGGNALAMLRDYGGGMSVPPLYKKY